MSYKNVDLSSVLKHVAAKAVISEVPLIKRAITYTQGEDLILKTDGINMSVSEDVSDVLICIQMFMFFLLLLF